MKKIISLATILTVAAMVAGPANAATVAELQAQINSLLATLQGLQAQLTAAGGATAPSACAGVTSFASNMTVGSSGQSVKCLQAVLNQSADTQVAASGAGSPGSETTYFGNLTKTAVVKYQTKKAISPAAGYVGPLTRASLNTALAGGTGMIATGGTGGTNVVTPACSALTEGSYTVTLSAAPVSRTVNGGAGIEAYGIDIKAVGSDVLVGSIDLQTLVQVGVPAVTWGPSTFITGIKVYKDSVSAANLAATYTNPVFNLDTANIYYTSLTGLNLKIANGATTKVLIVLDTVESSDNNRTVTLQVYGNGIRGRDCAGIDRFAALATNRVLTIQPASGNATLVLSGASDNPDSTNIQSNLTTGVTTDTPVLKFNAKAQSGNITLLRLEVAYASDLAAVASTANPSILKLYDSAGTLVQSCTPGAAEQGICTFENFRYPISAEVTQGFTVMANWIAKANSNSSLFQANIPATSAHSIFERSNGSQIQTTVTGGIQGNIMYVYEQGAKFTFISGVATAVPGGTTQVGSVTAVLKFKVQAFGQTFSQLTQASDGTNSTNTVFAEFVWASGSDVRNSGNEPIISRVLQSSILTDLMDGQSADITVTMTAALTTQAGGALSGGANLRGRIYAINWADNLLIADRCQGTIALCGASGLAAGNSFVDTNNLTNNWVTNWSMLTAGI